MLRRIVVCVTSLTLLAAVGLSLAEQKVVTKDGRTFVGEVTTAKDGYVVKTAYGEIKLAADAVASITEVKTPQDEYKQQLAATDQKDPDSLYKLADWAYKKGMLTEARDALQAALKINANHEASKLLLKLVEKDIAERAHPTTKTTGPVGAGGITPEMLLKEDDIYRIRLAELRPEGEQVQVDFRNKVLDRFAKMMQGTGIAPFDDTNGERTFKSWKAADQAYYIMKYTDRESFAIRDDVVIKSDPAVIKDFRTKVWPVINNSCAAPACHGGANGQGSFKLFSAPLTDDKVVYTNFYILAEWSKGGNKMIDRKNPEDSLLLQYGLPASVAKYPHPGKGQGVFKGKDDASYKIIEDMIGKLHYPFLEGYRIDYKIPMLDKQPASAPAGG